MKQKISVLAVLIMLFCMTSSSFALEISSQGACIYNSDSGEFYFEQNADTAYAPASMTKIMTAYMIYEKINEGVIAKDTPIVISENAAKKSSDPDATNVKLNAGETKTIDELIDYILIPSACASCTAVGDALFGSEESLALAMTQKARDMKLDMYFEDASGLSDNNRMSPRAVAILVDTFIKKYPDILNYTAKKSVKSGDITYKSTNKMLYGEKYAYWGVDGFKTGTTTLAGCCFVCTAQLNGIRMISVTMHSQTDAKRFEDTKNMLDYAFWAADTWYTTLYSTNLSAFVDGEEMPAFWYNGKNKGLMLIFEDLKDYGFDIVWDENTKTVHAYQNPYKNATPIKMDYYKSFDAWTSMMKINTEDHINAVLHMDDMEYIFKNTYPCGGYIAVSADELGAVLTKKIWNENEKSLMLYTK